MERSFRLPTEFVNSYKDIPEPFGFNGLGAITFYRTYSRTKPDGSMESWADVCERVINFMYSVQKNKINGNSDKWDEDKAIRSAQDAFDRLFNLKWSPPGRGLWMAGSDFIYDRENVEALNNCAFISTKDIQDNPGEIFAWIMNMLMMGVGVGFDVRGAGKVKIAGNNNASLSLTKSYKIPDSREGWVESVRLLIDYYLKNGLLLPIFDYSAIREKGEPIKGFGGTSSGYEPLKKLHDRIHRVFMGRHGEEVTAKDITDISNMIAACVIAGNVRRSAQISLGPDDDEFLDLKDYSKNPDREKWGWASNNSVIVDRLDGDYNGIAKRILNNGEPGLFFLPNVSKYARMGEFKDDPAIGANPCSEQFLESLEMCTLSEIYISRHSNVLDLLKTIKYAYLYAKSISITNEFIKHKGTRDVMVKNRRIGLSLTGIAQFLEDHTIGELVKWMELGYNEVQRYDHVYSEWLSIPESLRTTTIKPSGTVSLLAGATPGIHFPISPYYIRRIRISDLSPLLPILENAGYYIEKDQYSDNTSVVSFPIHVGNIRSEKEVSPWEQLKLTAIAQKHWSDNGVSVTIKFDPEKTTEKDIEAMLDHYQYELKAVSFLPDIGTGAYAQMPYEGITKERYESMISKISYIDFSEITGSRDSSDLYCDGDSCYIGPAK